MHLFMSKNLIKFVAPVKIESKHVTQAISHILLILEVFINIYTPSTNVRTLNNHFIVVFRLFALLCWCPGCTPLLQSSQTLCFCCCCCLTTCCEGWHSQHKHTIVEHIQQSKEQKKPVIRTTIDEYYIKCTHQNFSSQIITFHYILLSSKLLQHFSFSFFRIFFGFVSFLFWAFFTFDYVDLEVILRPFDFINMFFVCMILCTSSQNKFITFLVHLNLFQFWLIIMSEIPTFMQISNYRCGLK